MTTLADLGQGAQFLFVASVTAVDGQGYHLSLYGPGASSAGSALIGPDGTMSGMLALPASQVPVTVVTGFAPVAPGDVLENGQTGETAVCRWSQIRGDGTVAWAASVSRQVIYPAAGWTVIGHVSL